MRKIILLLTFFTVVAKASIGQIIDVHMHSYIEKNFWVGTARNGLISSKTAKETLEETIKKMNQHDIKYAVVSGPIESLERYTKADKRFIPGYQDSEDTLIPLKQFEDYVKAGKIKVFGEVMAVYKGKTLADSSYQPYLAICEKYGVPVGCPSPLNDWTKMENHFRTIKFKESWQECTENGVKHKSSRSSRKLSKMA